MPKAGNNPVNKRDTLLLAIGAVAVYLWSKSTSGVKMAPSKILTFVTSAVNGARTASAEYNLPIWLFLTAGAHESGMGLSKLAQDGFNFFGITADNPKDPWNVAGKPRVFYETKEWIGGKPTVVKRYFRKYASPADSFRDYGRLLTSNARYAKAVAAAREGDVVGTFKALGASGYATDPTYGTKLAGVYSSVKDFIA